MYQPFFFRAQQVAQSMVKEELYTPNGGWGHYPDYHPHYDYYPNAATTPHTNLQHQQVVCQIFICFIKGKAVEGLGSIHI